MSSYVSACPAYRSQLTTSVCLTSPPFASERTMDDPHILTLDDGGWRVHQNSKQPARASQNPPRKAADEFGGWRPANIIFIFFMIK